MPDFWWWWLGLGFVIGALVVNILYLIFVR